MALAHCILGKFLGVGCHCFPLPLEFPTFSARYLHVQRRERPLAAEGGTLRGREMYRQISSRIRLPRNSRDLLHAANLRHGTDGFTSPPKEGVLRIILIISSAIGHKTWSKNFMYQIFKNWVSSTAHLKQNDLYKYQPVTILRGNGHRWLWKSYKA
jgi:hypothetical protein